MRTRAVSLAFTLSLLSPLALADNGSFDQYDADGDGGLSEQEFMSSAGDIGAFDNWDNNNDGLLEENEYSAIGLNEDFDDWDDDDDGFLGGDEFYGSTYDAFDNNGDGLWQVDEWDDAGDAGVLDV